LERPANPSYAMSSGRFTDSSFLKRATCTLCRSIYP
jgi:hypothetical protein